jgi:hypothetical protein
LPEITGKPGLLKEIYRNSEKEAIPPGYPRDKIANRVILRPVKND